MRRAFTLVGLSALGGCSLLVDLNGLSSASDAAPDSSAADAAPDAMAVDAADAAPQDSGPCADGGAAVVESVTPSNADTLIVQGNPTFNFGTHPTANVSSTLASAGLLRFAVSSAAVAAFNAGRVVNVEFTLARVVSDTTDCGGTCPAAAGTLSIHPMTTNWVEGDAKTGSGASWNTRDGSAAWDLAGALGPTDIAGADASVSFDGSALLLTFALPGSAFTGFVGSSDLAIRVGPSGTVIFVIATKENTAYAKPVVKVTYCP